MSELRYRCLIIDHDDTAVDSTAEIHYPAHVEMMQKLRPGLPPVTLDQWFEKNFDPGVMSFLEDELGLSREELAEEFEIWRAYTSVRIPHFYPGMLDLLRWFRDQGGKIAVVSHSEKDLIERDYLSASDGSPFVPDLIFGWNHDETRRKPHPWPALESLSAFGCAPGEAIILDDLKPGVLMGQASGIAVAGAGWGHRIPKIRRYMEQSCVAYFTTVPEFGRFLRG
ncbi:MAG TPA: HAD family phosphatase [Spirochaetia bacterium]|nr:HAD family phosphatase [Spirochaetia bacterium]